MENYKKLKIAIVSQLKEKVQKDLETATAAYETVKRHASDQDMKQESKYDTRGIEAGYLAGAQKKRVDELGLELNLLDEIVLDHSVDAVCVGSLVSMELNGLSRYYFISSTSGGSALSIEGTSILVISAFSPIGSEAIGLKASDSFEVEVAGGKREYKILGIY